MKSFTFPPGTKIESLIETKTVFEKLSEIMESLKRIEASISKQSVNSPDNKDNANNVQ